MVVSRAMGHHAMASAEKPTDFLALARHVQIKILIMAIVIMTNALPFTDFGSRKNARTLSQCS